MNDDLISRKALLNKAEYDRNGRLVIPYRAVENTPTAFDKEKVIEELVELRRIEYDNSDEEPELLDGEEIYDEGRSQGRFEAYHRAIEIVEKGGIE